MGNQIRNQSDEHALAAGCFFDEKSAERVVKFFRKFLRHSKGQWAGNPFELMDWQVTDVIYPIFGWKRADGLRRFNRVFIEIPKKNGKSTLAAGVGIYMLCGDGEQGAEVYSCATDKEQASIVHGEAINMVEASGPLSSMLTVNRTTKTIGHGRSRSLYRALSRDAGTKEGLNIHSAICDELHVWRGRELWDTLRYGYAARTQPLIFSITTAGDDITSICYQQYEYAKGVISGVIKDATFFGYIREAGRDDPFEDSATWAKANPSLDITINREEMGQAATEAARSASSLSAFKRYRLNIWSTSTNPAINMDDWKDNQIEVTEDMLKGRPCFAGLDLAKTQDTTAFVMCFVLDDGVMCLVPRFWLPINTAKKLQTVIPYFDWQRDQHMTLTDGDVCDYNVVQRDIIELCKKYSIKKVAYDPYNAEQLTQNISTLAGIERMSFPQTIQNFAPPTSEIERMIISGTMKHDGNPVMTWQIGNVQFKTDMNNNKRPVKPEGKDHRKIDGVVAAIMALALAMQNKNDDVSHYETNELRWI